jgi:hypothetical protein
MERWRITANLIMARSGHSATLLPNGNVLVHGGAGYPGRSAELFHPDTETWSGTGTSLHAHGKAFLLGNDKVLSMGEYIERYDPLRGEWQFFGKSSIWGDAVLLRNGSVLVIGRNHCGLYNPFTNTWTPIAPLIAKL